MARRFNAVEAPQQLDMFSLFASAPVAEVVDLPLAPLPAAVVKAVRPPKAERLNPVWPAFAVEIPGGEVGKFDANIAAIKLVKTLAEEGREPTDAERSILNAYSGWGSLGAKFDSVEQSWQNRIDALDALLTEAERKSVRESVNNAHYTSQDVIEAMWSIVSRLGFTGGRVLEPSVGTGFFIGAMPKEIAERSVITAVEIDTVSAGITQSLYGQYGVKVHACGFEQAPLPEGFFDLAISNVPFGNYQVVDPKAKAYGRFSIHNYFFAKALEVVRPGGLIAFVTSSFTLDATNDAVRSHLAKKAKFIGAFRLPDTAFKGVAGTEVVTDVIVLQKREAGEVAEGDSGWVRSLPFGVNRLGLPHWQSRNQWYADHPERLIGRFDTGRGMHGSLSLTVKFDGDLKVAMAQQVAAFPEGIYHRAAVKEAKDSGGKTVFTMVDASLDLPLGSYLFKGDKLWKRATEEAATEVVATGKTLQRILGLIEVRDVARELVKAQVQSDVPEAALIRLREKLNVAYDDFTRKFGSLGDRGSSRVFGDDPSMPLLRSLEVVDSKTGGVAKAALFTRRTAGGAAAKPVVTSMADAVAVVRAKHGAIDLGAMGALLDMDAEDVRENVLRDGLAFIDPATQTMVAADGYLSGNVRAKLKVAEVAGSEFAGNVAALKAVIPMDLTPVEIGATLGSTWIPGGVYSQWIAECLDTEDIGVHRSAQSGTFEVEASKFNRSYPTGQGAIHFGTKRMDAFTLMEQSLNQQVPTIKDRVDGGDKPVYVVNTAATIEARAKQDEMKAAFVEWLWSDASRAENLGRVYNDLFNGWVQWEPDGSRLTLPGFSFWHTPSPHQLNGVQRIVAGQRNTLLAHVVGAGKTITMVCAGMELRRLGKARKPLYVVPNHMLQQFGTEFLRSYPSANILVAGKADFEGDKRRELLARMATGDWDAVVMTHSMFERIKLSPSYIKGYVNQRLDELLVEISTAKDNSPTFKELQRMKKQWKARLAKLTEGKEKDNVLTFDQLGIDWLFVDEAHLFKNLYRFTKMTRVAGLPNSNSERSFDMLLKTRHIAESRDDANGVVFATGTPVANSMAELWVMQHYLQPATLEAAGVGCFDAWASSFGQVVTAVELAPDGSRYRTNRRFAKFVNLPELLGMFSEVADIKTAEMLKLPVPRAEMETVVAPKSSDLEAYVATLVERADKIHEGRVQPQDDNMLKVTNDGRKAALDMRLVDVRYADAPQSKVNLCVARVHGIWKETAASRSTQLVFCDLSTPSSEGFNVYDDVKAKLEKRGVPSDQIAFIHDYDTDIAKERLFESVRQGAVRILLGSTEKMGMGTNVQDRLVALHHLDAPWRPADVEQRDGRMIRRGNANAAARILRYVTEGSFDAYMWQTLETKARFIAQVMAGDRAMRTAEDVELAALSYAEVKALASGNPMVLEKAGVDAEVAKLTILRTQHERRQADGRREVASAPGYVESERVRLAKLEADAAEAAKVVSEPLVILGKTFTTAKAQAEALEQVRARVLSSGMRFDSGWKQIGSWGGFTLSMKATVFAQDAGVFLGLDGQTHAEQQVPRTGSFILAALGGLAEQFGVSGQKVIASIALMEARVASLSTQVNAPFDGAEKLTHLLQRQAEINKELGIFDAASGAGDADDDGQEFAQAA